MHIKIMVMKLGYIIGIIVVVLFICFLLFMRLWVPFGGYVSNSDKDLYLKKSGNYRNGKFINEDGVDSLISVSEEDRFISSSGLAPKETIKMMEPNFLQNLNVDDFTVTWLGHSSVLFQMQRMNILFDPIFSDRASFFSMLGPKRFSESIDVNQIPNIDILIITHDHYDHLDYKTISKLDSKVSRYVVPLGISSHLKRFGVDESKITELAWWENTNINGLDVICTPSLHYSKRRIFDKNKTLWASFILKNDFYQIYESSDTGYGKHFEEIYKKYGSFDLALIDSGQYNESKPLDHMNPENAVKAGMDLHSSIVMPIHYGTFKLSTHPWDDSIKRFVLESKNKNVNMIAPRIGQSVNFKDNYVFEKWWEDIE